MEQHPSTKLYQMICHISTVFAWIAIQDAQTLAAIFASTIAGISGILAGVNWWYSIQERRQNLKNLKSNKS